MRRTSIIIMAYLVLAMPVVLAAGVYKWVDENGKVHYGDRPNPGAQTMPVPSAPRGDATLQQRTERRDKLLQSFEEERKATEEGRSKAKLERARREQECALAQARLKNYQDARYIYVQDKDKRDILTETQRKTAEDEAKQAVAQWCE